jgi:hypothetical protein
VIQYGKPIRVGQNGLHLLVQRDGRNVSLWNDEHGYDFPTLLAEMKYPELLQVIARLNEAAKDAAKEKVNGKQATTQR